MSFSNAGFAKLCFAIILFSFFSNNSKAQTTLVKGDIAFTGYYSNGTAPSLNDQFSFVLLTGITNNTVINFTDNGWLRTSPTTGSFRTGEGTVTYTSNGTYNAGTEILITITSGSTATATLVGGASAGTATGSVMPNFSANGDQVIAYQGTAASPTFISAIHMNVYSTTSIPPDIPGGDAVTTTTTEWDGAENTPNASGLPALGGSNFLTNGTDALWIPGSIIAEKDNARFNCTGSLATAAQARASINNVANWVTNNDDPSVGPPAFGILPTGCSIITALPAPSFTTNPSSATICENANTTFTVAASNTTGYQWQVDNGGGFTNITNNTIYSGATTASLTITGATVSMNGYLYRAVASNGSGSTNSTSATLTVTALPVNPTLAAKTPATIIVSDGTNVSATFNAGSGGTGCADDYRYTINGGATYLPYTPGTNISTTGLAAASGYVFIEGRRANCSSSCQNSYVVLASWQVSPLPGGATTLAAGDIAFSGYIGGNNIAADEFSFVLLKNMGAGTAINFTSTGWLSTNTFGAAEETVTWTVPAGGLAAGTEIRIAGTTATRSGGGAAGTVTGSALTFSVNGDQVLAYTGSSGSPTFISGIHMNVYSTGNGDPVTTSAAAWDGTASGINASALPTGLTTGTNAIWIGVSGDINSEFDNAKFGNCNNPAVPGSISALRAALNNRLNWITSNGGDPASFSLPTGCNYLSTLCPTITVTNPATATGVAGTAFSQTFTSAGGVPTVTYSTTSTLPTGLTLSSTGVLSGTPTQTGSFPIVVVATDGGGCTGTGSTYTLVISCPAVSTPTITPGGPTTFCTGGSVILTSSAATNNQWYVGGNPIGGATNQTYTATASGSYTVVQTSPYAGCNSSPSAAVVVTVNTTPATPTITPGGPTTFCAGGSVTLTSSAASGNQWYVGGNPIGGATNQTYSATASGVYTVVVTASGCSSAPSSGTTVTVTPLPSTPTVTPGGPTTFCTGGSVVLTSSSASGNQWYVGGNPIGGATNQTYTATASGTYTVVVTASGCSSAPSAGTTVTVNTTPATPTITPGGPTTFCAGGSVVLTSSAASGNQWYVGGNPIGGATNQTYTATASGTYTVVVTLSGCSSASSSGTTVTVNPIPATPTITPGGPTTFCTGGSVVLTSSAASGNQWYVGGNPIGGATNQTYTATASGTYTVVVTASGCSSAPSAGTTVTVNTTPVATATPAAQTVCSGGTITTIVLSSSVGSTTYSWTRDNTAGVTGIAASGTTDISGSLINTTTAPVTVTFTITPAANSCTGAPITATVTVNPQPNVVKPTDQVLCNGQSTAAINFTGSVPGTTYSWTNNNSSIGLAANGTGNIASFAAINTTNAPVTATITVTPTISGGSSAPVPELLYYKFDGTGNIVPNLASAPPAGTANGTLLGSISQGGNGICNGTLIGSGNSSVSDYVHTGWQTNLPGVPWTVSFKTANIASSSLLYYVFGDINAGEFRCFTNGVAGPNNWILRGNGIVDVTVYGGATVAEHTTTFVYDNVTNVIKGYLDGVLVTTVPQVAPVLVGTGPFKVGGYATNTGLSAGGLMDEFRFYNRALTDAEVATLIACETSCQGTPQTFTITVNPTPAVTATPSAQTICSGPITTIALSSAVSGTTFNWTRDNTAGVTGIAASGSGDISGSLTNTTAAPLTVTFTITPTANGCAGTPITATVVVNPRPAITATPASQTVCSGPITTINLTSTVTSTTYAWTRDNTVNVTGIAASGSGSSISGTLTNNTTVPQTVTFTITPTSPDGCGGTPITATVTVNAVPTITCPANIVVSNTANQCGAAVTYTPTVTGIPAPTVTYTLTGATTGSGNGNASGTFFNIGTTTVSLTATNTCGTANCSFTVTVNDTQNPTITCPAPVTVSCVSAVPAVNTGSVTAADNCPGVVVTHRGDVISAQTCANRYTITRTYRATDASGNFVECTQIITVNDQTPPVMTCPAPVTVSCASAVPAPNIAAVTGVSDNCGGTVTVTHVGDVISAQTCANRYTITRTYRATDVCGNFAECTQIITVNDQTPPVMTCPAPITVSCASAVPAPNIAAVTGVSDNCGGTVTVTHVSDVISAQTCANRYTITRTYRATDVCGNFTQCTQIITVNDQTAPVITCPANITVTTPFGSCTAVVNFAATATDNCGGTITYSYSHAPGSAFPIGTTTVTATATDVCGNNASCTFTITVNDGQLPVITAQPVNRTVCAGTTAIFSVTAVTAPNAGGPLSYQWEQWNGSSWVDVAGATSATLTLNSVTHAMNDNSYRVRVIGRCTTVISNFATLRVNPLPTISITVSPLTVLLPGQTTTLTAVTNQPGGTYVWLLNGQPTGATGATLAGLTIDNLGAYSVRYTDPNGCVSTSAVINIGALQTELMWVYPNPNFGQFQVRVYSTSNTPFTVNVYDSKGSRVFTRTASPTQAYTSIPIDLGMKAMGMYIVELRDNTGRKLGSKQVMVHIR